MDKTELTHIVDQAGSVLGGLEERRVGGVLEVASVLLKGSFVESLLLKNKVFSIYMKRIKAKTGPMILIPGALLDLVDCSCIAAAM